MDKRIIHVTADVPEDLVKRVDQRVKKMGVSRSVAVRQGLALFLRQKHQYLTDVETESINHARR